MGSHELYEALDTVQCSEESIFLPTKTTPYVRNEYLSAATSITLVK